MEVSGFLHDPAVLHPSKGPPILLNRRVSEAYAQTERTKELGECPE
jgi:hypothetical protein